MERRSTSHKTRKRAAPPVSLPPEDLLEETLEEFYQEPDGTVPDMKHFERARNRTGATVAFFTLVVLALASGAAWLGYFVFTPAQKFSEQQISVTISAPQPVIIGVPQKYVVTVRNDSVLALASSEVYVKLPQPFVVTDAQPAAATNKYERWITGSVDAGSVKTITITGVQGISPSPAPAAMARALLSYRPSNFNADFQKSVDQPLGDPTLPFVLRINATTKDKKTQQLVATIKNETAEIISGTTAVITVGTGFVISTSTPVAQMRGVEALVPLPAIAPQTEQKITITGTLGPTGLATQKFLVNRLVEQTELLIASASQERTALPQAIVGVESTQPLIIVTRTAGTEASTVRPNEFVDISLTFTNTTLKPLKNVALQLQVEAPSVQNKSVFDYTRLDTIGEPDIIGKQLSPTRRLGTITWKVGTKLPELKELSPSQTVTLSARLFARDAETLSAAADDLTVAITGKMIADGTTLATEPTTLQLIK